DRLDAEAGGEMAVVAGASVGRFGGFSGAEIAAEIVAVWGKSGRGAAGGDGVFPNGENRRAVVDDRSGGVAVDPHGTGFESSDAAWFVAGVCRAAIRKRREMGGRDGEVDAGAWV